MHTARIRRKAALILRVELVGLVQVLDRHKTRRWLVGAPWPSCRTVEIPSSHSLASQSIRRAARADHRTTQSGWQKLPGSSPGAPPLQGYTPLPRLAPGDTPEGLSL